MLVPFHVFIVTVVLPVAFRYIVTGLFPCIDIPCCEIVDSSVCRYLKLSVPTMALEITTTVSVSPSSVINNHTFEGLNTHFTRVLYIIA